MNAPIDIHFSPIARVEQTFSAAEGNRILWDIVRDCFETQQTIRPELRAVKLTARATFRAPWAPTTEIVESPILAGLMQSKPFPPATAMLAGVCRHLFDFQPDYASVSLYADGSDFLDWHTDSDVLCGPAGGHAPIATFSFGAERELCFARIGSEQIVESLRPAHGSAYLMDPRCQRYFQHCVPKVDAPVGTRVAVSFFCGQRDDKRLVWWTVVADETLRPIACAPPLEAYKIMIEYGEHRCSLATPFGNSDSSYMIEDWLRRLAMFDDDVRAQIRELRQRFPANGVTIHGRESADADAPATDLPPPAPPGLDASLLDPSFIDQLMGDPVARKMAIEVVSRMRCDRCKQPSMPARLVYGTRAMLLERLTVSDISQEPDLCLACVQQVLGRPLRASELAVVPINRNVLQAFVLGCDHNLLEERRTEAENLIVEVENVFGPTPSS